VGWACTTTHNKSTKKTEAISNGRCEGVIQLLKLTTHAPLAWLRMGATRGVRHRGSKMKIRDFCVGLGLPLRIISEEAKKWF